MLPSASHTVGRTLQELDLARFHVDVTVIRQRNIRDSAPQQETQLSKGGMIVLRGRQEDLIVAEMFLLQG